MDLNKKRLLLNAFFMSEFNYCQLVWMCHNHTKNNRINWLHKRCIRLIYNDKKSSSEELLETDSSASIQDRNLRTLAIDMYKIYQGISPNIMNEVFTLRHQNQYNFRNWTYFDVPKVRTVNNGSESVRYLGPKIWEIILKQINELDTTDKFKVAIKKWKPESCPRGLCKVFLQNIGYI